MFYAIDRLDAEKFSRLDFSMNFGIESHIRKLFVDVLVSGGSYDWICENVFAKVPTL